MNKVYATFRLYVFIFGCLLLFQHQLKAQSDSKIESGVVRLKVSEELALQLEATSFFRNSTGEIVTGISGLDRFNRLYEVREFRPVFRSGGKFEQRHRKHGLHRWYELQIGVPGAELQAVSSFRSIIQIEKAEPVYKKVRIGLTGSNNKPVIYNGLTSKPILPAGANDPLLNRQWHYNNTGQTGGIPGSDISLLEAWKKETGNPSVIVAVTDGGIQTDHPDLEPNLWTNGDEIANNGIDDDQNGFIDDVHGYSFVNGSGTIIPDDHGTHVAGTIAAVSNNGIGVAGVAGGTGTGDGVRVMSCAVFSSYYSGGFAESYVYAADNGAVISQNSWGYTLPNVFEEIVLESIDYFIAEAGRDEFGNQVSLMDGGLVIFAAGNSSSDGAYYPAFYEPTFAVAGTTHKDTKAWYSNYGTWADIAAPGGETNSVQDQGVLSTLASGNYGFFQGTSMACPHVSGVAALVLSKFGRAGFKPDMLRQRLRQTSFSIDDLNPSFRRKLGAGRIDARMALQDNDATAPLPVTDLSAANSGIGEVTLSWTTPLDENGYVNAYDIRYSAFPIGENNFEQAIRAGTPVAIAGVGDENFVITGLPGKTLIHFAIKALDFQMNKSSLSNVVSLETLAAPAIVVSPASLNSVLLTAQTETLSFSIINEGEGPLDFSIPNSNEAPTFALCSPGLGSVWPDEPIVVEVQFSSEGLWEGTYEKNLIIRSSDPLRPEVTVPLVLKVTDNGLPVVRWEPWELNFKSVKTGATASKNITISNAGTEPLKIDRITFNHAAFSADSINLTIDPFESKTIAIKFSPVSNGLITGTTSIFTNDPKKPVLEIALTGEGLNILPIEILPPTIFESLEKGTIISRSLTIKNNGSFDRNYSMEVDQLEERGSSLGRLSENKISGDSVRNKIAQFRKQVYSAIESGKLQAESKILSIQSNKAGTASGKTSMASPIDDHFYQTDFEEFNQGPIDGQEGWFAFEGWNITDENPNRGLLHLRGEAISPGIETYSISPSIFGVDNEEFPTYTAATTRVNLANATGGIWQIIPQDTYFVVTRIVINPDRTIDVMSVDPDYNILWNRIDFEITQDYLDIAVEVNSVGDGTSGFPVFDVYLNHQRVFRGYSLGAMLDNMAFAFTPSVSGGLLDIDGVMIREGTYTPQYIFLDPPAGVIVAGGEAEVDMLIDATSMRFGVYESEIITRIDEDETIIVPAKVEIIGEGSMTTEPTELYAHAFPGIDIEMELTLINTGGEVISYRIESTLSGLLIQDSLGILQMQERKTILLNLDTDLAPGIYMDTLRIITSLKNDSVILKPLRIIIWESDAIYSQPENVLRPVVYSGEITSVPFEFSNNGDKPLAFFSLIYGGQTEISVDPVSGVLGPHEVMQATLTIDARYLPEGERSNYFYIENNDIRHPYGAFSVYYDVLPNRRDGSGKVDREVWNNRPGRKVSSIPVGLPADTVLELNTLDGPVNVSDNYGARIRGYVKAPMSGPYTFWIASDDQSQLWLSEDTSPSKKKLIASVNSFVPRENYDMYASQKSAVIELEANQKYYFEILHKENTGRDHVSVGWQLPDESREFPIGPNRLSKFGGTIPANEMPVISFVSPDDGSEFDEPALVYLQAEAMDPDGSIIKVEFYNGAEKIRTDATYPYDYHWRDVPVGDYELIAKAYDNVGGATSTSVHIKVTHEPCVGAGNIQREVWRNISGRNISSIPFHVSPDQVTELSLLESSITEGDYYGSRIRGFVCVPTTGAYTFWISSDDNSELWLSTDDDPAGKKILASVTGYTKFRQWTKYGSQQSIPVELKAGYRYYIEVRHKEAKGQDHVSVGWRLPDGTLERPIPGSRIIPFESGIVAPQLAGNNSLARMDETENNVEVQEERELVVYPNPSRDGIINVDVPGNEKLVTIQLVSVNGSVVYDTKVSCEAGCRSLLIECEEPLQPGVYILHVNNGVKRFLGRIIIL